MKIKLIRKSLFIIGILIIFTTFISSVHAESLSLLKKAVNSGDIKEITRLIEMNISNINQLDSTGRTVLFDAILKNNPDIVNVLLKNGSDPNIVDFGNVNPLLLSGLQDNSDILALLFKYNVKLPIGEKLDYFLVELISMRKTNALRYILEDKISLFKNHRCLKLGQEAAKINYVELISFLLEKGLNPNITDENGTTLLHIASYYKSFEVLTVLINAKADLNIKDKMGYTPISYSNDQRIARLLIQHDADLSITLHGKQTILHHAIVMQEEEVVKLLIEKGVDIDLADDEGRTPISLSAEMGQVEIVKILLAKGANPNNEDKFGMKPIHYAANSQIAEILLKSGYRQNLKAITPLHTASAFDRLSVVKYFIENNYFQTDEITIEDQTPLMYLAEKSCGLTDTADYLISKGAKINNIDKYGRSLLHYAAQNIGNRNLMQYLLVKGIPIDTTNLLGETPLHISCRCGNEDVVELLLKKGADFNKLTEMKATPLHYAVQGNNKQIVIDLIENGVNINQQDELGLAPIHHIQSSEVLEVFINRGANLTLQAKDGSTLLHHAVRSGNLDLVMNILDLKPEIEIRDNHNKSALHYAIESNSVPIIHQLIMAGCLVNGKDYKKNTPLHYAVMQGNIGIVRLLLLSNADITSINIDKKTPLDIALDKKQNDIIILLKSFIKL
jgi:ankyrin repeat protein